MKSVAKTAPKPARQHLLLFASKAGYQIRVFAAAARRLGIEVTLASDRCHQLDDPWNDRAIAVNFDRIEHSLGILRELAIDSAIDLAIDGVAAVGDRPAVLAAAAAEFFGVPFHPVAAARACHDKHLARQLFQAAGMRVPEFWIASLAGDARALAARAPYPCVLKPLGQSGSRGVIRANNQDEFAAAFRRIGQMGERDLQVEAYIPGREFAIEALVTAGRMQPIAIFDKPDPLEGPYFEETIYVTPSREAAAVQEALLETTAQAVAALGLRHGPVHAELRYNDEGAYMLEIHARPIGGLCARALRFTGGVPFEELILSHALGGDVSAAQLDAAAVGVMMIPVPGPGLYRSVSGIEEARGVPGIEDVVITATEGQLLIPLPEGSSYLGFIFARAEAPEAVERALRQAHVQLKFEIAAVLEMLRPGI
jgi:biotin carboxylase